MGLPSMFHTGSQITEGSHKHSAQITGELQVNQLINLCTPHRTRGTKQSEKSVENASGCSLVLSFKIK